MTIIEALEMKDAKERALKEFSHMQIWRWQNGKTKPCAMNAAKLAKCLGLEIGFENGNFYFWKQGCEESPANPEGELDPK